MRIFRISCIVCCTGCLWGCGVTGVWQSDALHPEMAREEFRLLTPSGAPGEFTKTTLTLNKNKTYSAETYYGDFVEQSTGTWEREGDKITLVDSRGRSQTYYYDLSSDGGELRMVRPIRGTEVVLVLDRQRS